MKKIKSLIIILMISNTQSYAADNDHHHGHEASPQTTIAKPTKKFIADENLKQRMNTILETMMNLHKNESDKNKKHHVIAAGKAITATIQDIFKSCKLPADADAAIHPILTELLDGATLLEKGNDKKGHEKIHKALIKYEDYFDHAGWMHD